jgi:AbrB family looped-hinge helix DNA binding protein
VSRAGAGGPVGGEREREQTGRGEDGREPERLPVRDRPQGPTRDERRGDGQLVEAENDPDVVAALETVRKDDLSKRTAADRLVPARRRTGHSTGPTSTGSERPKAQVLRRVVPDMTTGNDTESKTTRITRKGQVTIPKELREEFGLEEGDELLWQKAEDGIRIRKATRSAGRGMLVDDDLPEERREEMAEAMEAEIRAIRRTEG